MRKMEKRRKTDSEGRALKKKIGKVSRACRGWVLVIRHKISRGRFGPLGQHYFRPYQKEELEGWLNRYRECSQ
jgi:hypothetical protein